MVSEQKVRYAVVGGGRFPLDMLRYDRSYPATEIDTHSAEGDWDRGIRIVVIEGHGCTPRRWESFTWSVIVQPEEVRGYWSRDEIKRVAQERLAERLG